MKMEQIKITKYISEPVQNNIEKIEELMPEIDQLKKSDIEKLIDALMEDVDEKYNDEEKSIIRHIIAQYLYG